MPLDGLDIGRYHLLRLIGSGGMGEVYLAEDARINRQVAIKVIRGEAIYYQDTSSTSDAARLFEREAKAIARLNHSHILPLFDYGEENVNDLPLTYMVMPYCPEGSLDTWLRLKGEKRETRSLPPQEAAYLLNQAADALQYAHDQQLVHQDVKPPNFLIRTSRAADLPDLLLTDFGVAKFIAAHSNSSQSVRGTPSYMAPEQWEGNPVIASDQYALGVMAYQLVTGRLPFQGGPGQMMYQHLISEPQPPSTHMPSLPVEIDAVILQALAKKPEHRFDSITAFARAFQQATRDGNATAFHLTSQNTSVSTAPSTPDSTVSSDPNATVVTRPPEEHRPPSSVSDERTVITGAREGSTIRATPTPAANSRTVSDHLPQIASNNNNIADQGQQPAHRNRRRILPLALVLLALVLITASVGAYYIIAGAHSPSFGGANATATAQVREQSTANAQATTHAYTLASATAQGKATATAQANPYAPNSGTLVINDPLSSNNKGYGWEEGVRDGGSCTFSAGSYHSSIPQNGVFHSCLALATNFSDFAFEVQATIISGSSSGIVFRADRTTTHLYYFILNENGDFYLKVYFDKFGTSSIVASGSSPAINSSGSNLIAVVARGSQIDLYVNRQLIKSLSDTTFQSGQVGVVALAGEVAFSNAKVWKL